MCLAVPGRVISIAEPPPDAEAAPLLRTGTVDFGGVTRDVSLAYVPDVDVGDYVVVHVGFAISKLDEQEALQVIRDLEYMSGLETAEDRPS